MAKAMGIVLTGTAINVGNQVVQGEGFNFRMGVAGLGAGLFLSGVEKLNERAGTGLAIIFFITVMFTPFKGKAPAETLSNLTKGKPPAEPGKVPEHLNPPGQQQPLPPGMGFFPPVSPSTYHV